MKNQPYQTVSRFARLRSLAFIFALIFSVTALVACSDPEKTKAEHVTRGEQLLKDKKFQEASLEFRNALQIDGNLAAAHWGLAQAYEGLMRVPEAVEELRKTVELDPNNLDARVRLGSIYVLAAQATPNEAEQYLTEAERLAREVLTRDPNNIEGHILDGNLLFTRGKTKEAEASLLRAVEINPQRVESHLSLGRFYLSSGNAPKAEETIKRAISINDSSAVAHLEYGKFLVTTNRIPQAENEFRRATEVDPNNRDARFVLASFYFGTKQYDKAEAAYKKLAEIDGDKPEGKAALADFYAATGKMDDAVRSYQELIATKPDYARARYRLTELLIQKGDFANARKQVDEALAKNERDTEALVLRARLNLIDGKAKEASNDLQQVVQIEPNSLPGLYFGAESALRLGNVEQARAYTGELERYYPTYLPAKLLQVQIALASNDTTNALRTANDLVTRSQNSAPDALTTPQMLEELRAKAFIARGTTQLRAGNLGAARADMQKAAEMMPNNPVVYNNLALVAGSEKNYGEALNYYERALQLDGSNAEALAGLVAIPGGAERAQARIEATLNGNPNNPQLHFLKGQALAARGDLGGAEAAFRRALEIDNNFSPAFYALAGMFINTNRAEQALAEYRKLVERKPDDSTAQTLIGILEDQRGNRQAAETAYRNAISANPSNDIAANNLSWLAAEYNIGNLDEAVRLMQGVIQRNPQVGFYDTLGWVYHKKGLQGAAIENLRKAVQMDGNSPLYRYHLAAALAAQGNKAEARREAEAALRLANNPKTNFDKADDARQLLAQL